MFEVPVKILNTMDKVEKAVTNGNYRNLNHAAASLRKAVRASMHTAPTASAPGRPPNTRRRQLPNAMLFNVSDDGTSAIIGPIFSRAGEAGFIHEFGGPHVGKDHAHRVFPPRPFMGPALEQAAPRMAAEWSNSIGAP